MQKLPTAKTNDKIAMQVLDRFLVAFNAHSPRGLSATCNFPHLRLASGKFTVWQTRAEFEKDSELTVPLEHDWHRTVWDWRKVVQSSNRKFHVALSFTRYDENGKKIGTFQSLYIITKQRAHWGIQARSSFAP
jgi:hypothetical protein